MGILSELMKGKGSASSSLPQKPSKKGVEVEVEETSGGHKYSDEAQSVLDAIESKDADALAEALELIVRNIAEDLEDETDEAGE